MDHFHILVRGCRTCLYGESIQSLVTSYIGCIWTSVDGCQIPVILLLPIKTGDNLVLSISFPLFSYLDCEVFVWPDKLYRFSGTCIEQFISIRWRKCSGFHALSGLVVGIGWTTKQWPPMQNICKTIFWLVSHIGTSAPIALQLTIAFLDFFSLYFIVMYMHYKAQHTPCQGSPLL